MPCVGYYKCFCKLHTARERVKPKLGLRQTEFVIEWGRNIKKYPDLGKSVRQVVQDIVEQFFAEGSEEKDLVHVEIDHAVLDTPVSMGCCREHKLTTQKILLLLMEKIEFRFFDSNLHITLTRIRV